MRSLRSCLEDDTIFENGLDAFGAHLGIVLLIPDLAQRGVDQLLQLPPGVCVAFPRKIR